MIDLEKFPPTTLENELTPRSEFVFAPSIHTAENLEAIATALDGCDTVALECFGGNNKDVFQDQLNALASYSVLSADKAALKEGMGEGARHILVLLAERLEGKKIVLIDLDDGHEGMRIADNTDRLFEDFVSALEGNFPNGEVRAAMLRALKADAALSVVREAHMAKQLRKLGEDNPGKKIGVVLGAVHTSVSHQISRDFPIERTFVNGSETPPHPIEIKRYRYGEEIERQYNLLKREKLTPTLIDRALLEAFFEERGFATSDHLGEGSVRTRVLENMSDEEVSDALVQVERVRLSGEGNALGQAVATLRTERLLQRYFDEFNSRKH